MNSLKLIAGSVVRHVLTIAFAWLVQRGFLDQQLAGSIPIGEIALGIVGLLGTLGWSLWQKAVSKWKFLQAVTLDPALIHSPELAEWVVNTKTRTIPGTVAVLLPNGGEK